MFITFEGGDGTGKSTQVRLLSEYLRNSGLDVVTTREPGGSVGAEEIRSLVLSGDVDRWSAETELLLFTAARRDHMEKTVWPAIKRGAVVISDRFVDSTRVYQGLVSENLRKLVDDLHRSMIAFDPARTFILDADPDVALSRGLARLSQGEVDEERFEKKGVSFQERLRQGFRELAASGPGRYRLIDASGTPDEVLSLLCNQLPPSLTDRMDAIHPSLS
ncbi:dTMP kinase [Epibacterium sp. DP7N7-1]|nr:dTMP kinase [Epibacterium sp. DP7N7-1]